MSAQPTQMIRMARVYRLNMLSAGFSTMQSVSHGFRQVKGRSGTSSTTHPLPEDTPGERGPDHPPASASPPGVGAPLAPGQPDAHQQALHSRAGPGTALQAPPGQVTVVPYAFCQTRSLSACHNCKCTCKSFADQC